MAKGDESPREPLVIISRRPWTCAGRGDDHEQGGFLTMDDSGPLVRDEARSKIRGAVERILTSWRTC